MFGSGKKLEKKEQEILALKAIVEKLLRHCKKSFISQQRLTYALRQKRAKQIENALEKNIMHPKAAEKAQMRFLDLTNEIYESILDEKHQIDDIKQEFKAMLEKIEKE